ncbi:RHS repeat-associated core domain-containing protein, partial [Ralstonia pseudosolanacearum]
GDTPVATVKNGTAYYIYADQIDTPRVITDTNNLMVWRWDQADPFGATLPDENPTSLGSFTYNLRFPGQVYDAETGKHYNANRDYDPAGGRYIQSDPIGLNGGQPSTYAYVGGNPLSFIDSLGLYDQEPGLTPVCIECALIPLVRIVKTAINACAVSKEPTFPESIFGSKAPKQVQPGTKSLKGQYINDKGRVEPWEAHYDEYGRQVGRTDYNAGNAAEGIPNTHHHTYEYGPGYGAGKETGSHIPGVYKP